MSLLNQDVLLSVIESIGYVGLAAIVFTETGIFFGALLPGDTLLFVAGLMSARHVLNLWIVMSLLMSMAFIGYLFGYWFGERLGPMLNDRPDGFWYRRKYLELARGFYSRHGAKAILMGRMVPVVRTFGAIVAGMVRMNYRRFIYFNFVGAVLWISCFTLLGYFLGDAFPVIADYLLPFALLLIVTMVFGPALLDKCRKKDKNSV